MEQAKIETIVDFVKPVLDAVFPEWISNEIIEYFPVNEFSYRVKITTLDDKLNNANHLGYIIDKILIDDIEFDGIKRSDKGFLLFDSVKGYSEFKNFTRYILKNHVIKGITKYKARCVVKVYNPRYAEAEYHFKKI